MENRIMRASEAKKQAWASFRLGWSGCHCDLVSNKELIEEKGGV